MMFDHFINPTVFFSSLCEMMCMWFMVGIFCEKRLYKNKNIFLLIYILFLSADYGIIVFLYDYVLIKIAIVICSATFFMFIVYNAKPMKLFMLVTIFMGMLVCLDGGTLFFIKHVHPEFVLLDISSPRYFAIFSIARIILLLLILFLKLKIECTNDLIGMKEWIGITAITLITIISGASLVTRMDDTTQDDRNIYVLIGMGVINFILFFLIDSLLKKEKTVRETRVQYEKNKNELNMYYSISENLDKQRKMSHEFKNHLSCINELAKLGKLDELKSYISKVDGEILEQTDMVDTNNVIVNAIINTKYREALEKGIVFVLKVNDLSNLPLSDMDIVTVLSNLLSNAFEACEQCGKDKVIKLKFVVEKSHTIISVKNTMAKKPMQKDGIFETTKMTEEQEHGMGIKNVCDVLGKYDAKYRIDYDEKEFSFSIVIKNNVGLL